MKLRTIAFKNVKKNLSFYSLYLFSVAFILTVFFTFASFSMNDIMMEKISEDGRVETMSRTISVFLMAFVLFYMSYSNKFFMKRRMKELGIYALLGYRKSAMLKLLTIENVLISLGALLIGIAWGPWPIKESLSGFPRCSIWGLMPPLSRYLTAKPCSTALYSSLRSS
ncbi:FtsX-like permease family protein [Paenibacillus sp. DMB20]|uniref:FtsX-like permease family protein n=1 Tax=Paenibacillus sp. DMB20 TaxID=1642570 RepID=UPI000A411A76